MHRFACLLFLFFLWSGPAGATVSLTLQGPHAQGYAGEVARFTVRGDKLRRVKLTFYRVTGGGGQGSPPARTFLFATSATSQQPRSSMQLAPRLHGPGMYQVEAQAGDGAGGTARDSTSFSVISRPVTVPTLYLDAPEEVAPPRAVTLRATGKQLQVARLRLWKLLADGSQQLVMDQAERMPPPPPPNTPEGNRYEAAIKWKPTLKSPGTYLAQVTSRHLRHLRTIRVTDLGLLAKRAPGEVVVYAVRLSTGAPFAGAAVRIDDQGYAEDIYDANGNSYRKVVRKAGPSRAAVTDTNGVVRFYGTPETGTLTLAAAGADGSRVAYHESPAPDVEGADHKLYFFTERPVYRPGQTVYFKGTARRDLAISGQRGPGGALFVPLPGARVEVEGTDAGNKKIYSKTFTTSAAGSFAGQLALPSDVAVGISSLEIRVTPRGEKEPTAHYNRFTVAEYRKPEYQVTLTPQLSRPFAVQGENFNVKVKAAYFFGGAVKGGNLEFSGTESGSTTLDQNGEATILVRNTLFATPVVQPDRTLELKVKVTDDANRIVEGQTSVLSVWGQVKPGIAPDKEAYSLQETATFTVSTLSPMGQAVPASARVRLYYYKSRTVKNPVTLVQEEVTSRHLFLEQTVTTNNFGRALVKAKIEHAGYLLATVESTDALGRTLLAERNFWGLSKAEQRWAGYDFPQVELLLDKATYRPGEKVRALLTTSKQKGFAFVTLQSDRIFMQRLVRLAGHVTLVEFAYPPAAAPGAYLQAGLASGQDWVEDGVFVRAISEGQRLKIGLVPDKNTYRPGETATYAVQVRDGLGKPRAAEVSLGLVDKAIYGLANDETPDPLEYFYGSRENLVNTTWQFPGEVAGGSYQRIEKRVPVRRDFRDTAYWNPVVQTGPDGRATVQVKLPDNLTTWRATARGFTADTSAGAAKNEILVTKPLLTRLILPRFVVQGDRVRAQVIVQNNTANSQELRVSLRGTNLETKALSPEISGAQTASVAGGSSASFWWEVGTDKLLDAGAASLTATARAGNLEDTTDAQELPLPVLPRGVPTASRRAGVLLGTPQASFTLQQSPARLAGSGRLQLTLSPSIAGPMLGSLEGLIQYPYGCTEQTLSRFVPALVASDTVKRLGLPRPAAMAQMPGIFQTARATLYSYQHSDGGWGWWRDDATDPFLTAYAVLSLSQAKAAGYEIDRERVVRGMGSLLSQFGESRLDGDARAYMMLAYSTARLIWKVDQEKELGRKDDFSGAVFGVRQELSAYGVASLALSELRSGRRERATTLLDMLEKMPQVEDGPEGQVALWSSRPGPAGSWTDAPLETTALALQALLEGRPNSPLVLPAVQRLMRSRQGDGWASTRETAQIVLTLARYLEKSGELNPDQQVEVLVNGQSLKKLQFTRQDLGKEEVKVELKPLDQDAAITLRRSGRGALYYSASLLSHEDGTLATGANRGIEVQKTYQLRNEKGYWRDVTGPIPAGSLVRVDLRVVVPQDLHYVMLQDPAPSGFEARPEEDANAQGGEEHADCVLDRMVVTDPPPGWSALETDRRDARDDHQAFFFTQLKKGRYYLRYILRPEQAGTRTALPARAEAMYRPEINGHSRASALEVK